MQSDEQLYELVAKELATSPRQGLLIKCMAKSAGEENKGKALYIETRVTEIKKEIRDLNCSKCNILMEKRTATKGRFSGKQFWGCPNFPECWEKIIYKDGDDKLWERQKNITHLHCPTCFSLMEKRTSSGIEHKGGYDKAFWGCSKYPQCDSSLIPYKNGDQNLWKRLEYQENGGGDYDDYNNSSCEQEPEYEGFDWDEWERDRERYGEDGSA